MVLEVGQPGPRHKNFLIGMTGISFLLLTLTVSLGLVERPTSPQTRAWWRPWWGPRSIGHPNIVPDSPPSPLSFDWRPIEYISWTSPQKLYFGGKVCNQSNQRRSLDIRVTATVNPEFVYPNVGYDVVDDLLWNTCRDFGVSFSLSSDWCSSDKNIIFNRDYKLVQDTDWNSLGSTTASPASLCPSPTPRVTATPIACLADGELCDPERPYLCCSGLCSPEATTLGAGTCTPGSPSPTPFPTPVASASPMPCLIDGTWGCRTSNHEMCCSGWCVETTHGVGYCGPSGPRPDGSPCNRNDECQSNFCKLIQNPEPGFGGECSTRQTCKNQWAVCSGEFDTRCCSPFSCQQTETGTWRCL